MSATDEALTPGCKEAGAKEEAEWQTQVEQQQAEMRQEAQQNEGDCGVDCKAKKGKTAGS